MAPKFSFVFPIYKVEKYLEDSVSSILSQTLNDYEIILVDDGSPDKCPEICDSLAQRNDKIKVIHKTNGGLSDARNKGTEIAVGEYIIFVDSDDKWKNHNALEHIYKIIASYNSPDVIIFGVEDFYPDKNLSVISRSYNENLNQYSKSQLIHSLVKENQFPGAAWMVITKRSLLSNNNISFQKGVTSEDYDWIIKTFNKAASIKVSNQIVYQYRYISEGSITSRPRLSGIKGIHNAISNWLNEPYKNRDLSVYLAKIYFYEILNYSGLSREDRISAKPLIKQDKYILKEAYNWKYDMLGLFVTMLGIGTMSRFMRCLRNIKKHKL